jgi:hypothetical protein
MVNLKVGGSARGDSGGVAIYFTAYSSKTMPVL